VCEFITQAFLVSIEPNMSDHTKLNIEHFDKRAASWDSPLKVALAKKCSDAMLQAEGVQWDSSSTVVVDFACGTGSLDVR